MAALRDIARDFAAEIRDGIGNRIRRYVFEALAAEGGGGP